MVLLYCFIQVKAGDGHSWKGSVVSDTVKRGGCPSVPVVSVQRRTQLHTRPSYGKVNVHHISFYSM